MPSIQPNDPITPAATQNVQTFVQGQTNKAQIALEQQRLKLQQDQLKLQAMEADQAAKLAEAQLAEGARQADLQSQTQLETTKMTGESYQRMNESNERVASESNRVRQQLQAEEIAAEQQATKKAQKFQLELEMLDRARLKAELPNTVEYATKRAEIERRMAQHDAKMVLAQTQLGKDEAEFELTASQMLTQIVPYTQGLQRMQQAGVDAATAAFSRFDQARAADFLTREGAFFSETLAIDPTAAARDLPLLDLQYGQFAPMNAIAHAAGFLKDKLTTDSGLNAEALERLEAMKSKLVPQAATSIAQAAIDELSRMQEIKATNLGGAQTSLSNLMTYLSAVGDTANSEARPSDEAVKATVQKHLSDLEKAGISRTAVASLIDGISKSAGEKAVAMDLEDKNKAVEGDRNGAAMLQSAFDGFTYKSLSRMSSAFNGAANGFVPKHVDAEEMASVLRIAITKDMSPDEFSKWVHTNPNLDEPTARWLWEQYNNPELQRAMSATNKTEAEIKAMQEQGMDLESELDPLDAEFIGRRGETLDVESAGLRQLLDSLQ